MSYRVRLTDEAARVVVQALCEYVGDSREDDIAEELIARLGGDVGA